MSPILSTVLLAMTPIGELRASIPVALSVYHLPIWQAYGWSVIGNMVPIFFILWLLEPVSKILREESKIMDKFFGWLFERTRRRHTRGFEKWGSLALIIFVAIPLPMTGAWSGSLAAFVFGVPYKKALGLIFGGVLIAGIIVTLVSTGVLSFLSFIV